MGFPPGSVVNHLHPRIWLKIQLIPGLRRSPEGENGNPLQYSCLENPIDKGALQATVHGVTRVGHDLATKLPPPPVFLPEESRGQRSLIGYSTWIRKELDVTE